MARTFDRFTTVWFDDRLEEVAAATRRGATPEAVDLLFQLWDQCPLPAVPLVAYPVSTLVNGRE